MKITIYELLGMIKDGKELPKKIKVLDVIYEFDDHYGDYYNERLDRYLFVYMTSGEEWKLAYFLNTTVEIIEEPQEHKIPEKIEIYNKEYDEDCKYIFDKYCQDIYISKSEEISINKINEILDYLEANND